MLQLITNLQTTKTSEKVRALEQFFNTAPESDKLWIIALFTGRRPKRVIKVSQLRHWACEFTDTPDWLFEESYAIVGDLAETIALLMPNNQESTIPFELTYWMLELKKVRNWEDTEQKSWIFKAWETLDAQQRFIFNKLLTGGFRIGVSMALIVKALEKSTGISRDDLHFRLSGNWDPYQTDFQSLILNPSQTYNPTKPYPFCLAYPIEDEGLIQNIAEWQIEYKWDGIRGQLIKRGDSITLWSRGEEIITPSFPEIAEAINNINFEGVLDGEIIAWDFEQNQPRPFADLQKRLGRKSPSKKTTTSNPCAFICYDILEHNTEDVRSQPLHYRRNLLEALFQYNFPQENPTSKASKHSAADELNEANVLNEQTQTSKASKHSAADELNEANVLNEQIQTSKASKHSAADELNEANVLNEQIQTSKASIPRPKGVYHDRREYTTSISLSEQLHPKSFRELQYLQQTAKIHHTEGLMLKKLNSEYGVGRKRGDWWKWKIEPETADAVLIYAQKGHGKRASRYTDFTFALKKGEELVPFAKAYSGLSNAELDEINKWIKDNTRERFGPVCSVNAELVFEIAFEGVNSSSRHKSGIAVRFPRIVRWRRDKKVSDINTVEDLLKL